MTLPYFFAAKNSYDVIDLSEHIFFNKTQFTSHLNFFILQMFPFILYASKIHFNYGFICIFVFVIKSISVKKFNVIERIFAILEQIMLIKHKL